ncbi:TonB-dependent receptor domain-containing protein [Dysgonomonas sp. Marseille-P4361]|uniref:TonB-dependent receptor n=1 Tax=Dysgonomonas sp. Marseille-P4361 TaxID=2161820 RepID=UPI000D559F60|nr:TonB-dependent receptor [Dysgonomonas sp. Marseille-P4361]
MVKKIFIILFYLLVNVSFYAQNRNIVLHGKVSDINNKPISGASIIVDEYLLSVTDDKGSFNGKIASGSYTVTIVCFGYETKVVDIEISNNKECNFELTPKTHELSTVEVKGKSKHQQLRESAYSVNALSVKSRTNDLNNLNTMVGRSSGIRVREKGGVGSDFELSINGLSGNAIRYFVNGIPLAYLGSEVNLSNLPINLVDRIEIYKGFVPSELGADALGGAINIITNINIKDYIDTSYGIGSFSTHKADFRAQYTERKTGIVIRPSFGINYSKNNYKMKDIQVKEKFIDEDGIERSRFKTTDAKRFHDDYLSLIGHLEVGVINKKWADSFFFSTSYSAINKELQTGAIQNIVYGKAEKENRSFGISANYIKNDLLIKNLSTNIFVSHTWDHSIVIDTAYQKYWWDGSFDNRIDSKMNEIMRSGKSKKHYKRPTTIGRASINYRLSNNQSFNLNYTLDRTGNKRYDEIDMDFKPSNDVVTKHVFGLSYSLNLFDNKLTNILFLKDYINNLRIGQQDLSHITGSKDIPNSSTNYNIGYGIASRYRFNSNFAIKASYEHAIRLPIARELLGNGTTVYPNLTLKPESSNNVNIGMFGEIDCNNKHHLYYEVGSFMRTVKDYIRYKPSPVEDRLGQYENLNNATVKGIEGELRYSYSSLFQAIVNCTYLEEKNKNKYLENGKPSATYNDQIPNTPWLYSNVELNVKKQNLFGAKDNQIKLAYYFQYVHWYYYTWKSAGGGDAKSRIPTQNISDLSLTYSLKNEKYNISLECTNIFDRLTYDNLKLQKPGRAFFCKMRFFFN